MAVTIEGFAVVAQRDRIQSHLDQNKIEPPNGRHVGDDDLWRCCFMAESDAYEFIHALEELGLNASEGPDSDVVLVSEFDQSIHPYCEWLTLANYEKSIIAWKTGATPESIIAEEGWDPAVGSGLHFHDESMMEKLTFVRLDGQTEVYKNNETGQEVYATRLKPTLDARFKSASAAIVENMRVAGEAPLTGELADQIQESIGVLEEILKEVPDSWRTLWVHGKGKIALGEYEAAYQSLKKAFDLESEEESVPRELAGVCLELGKFDEAVSVAERAVVLIPDSSAALGNLAISYLLAKRLPEAAKTVEAASKIDPEDQINHRIGKMIHEVATGLREQPNSMAELKNSPSSGSNKAAKKNPLWQFWKRNR